MAVFLVLLYFVCLFFWDMLHIAKQEKKKGKIRPTLIFIQYKQKEIFFSYFYLLQSKIINITRIILKRERHLELIHF